MGFFWRLLSLVLILILSCKSVPNDNISQNLAHYITNSYLSEDDLRVLEPNDRRFHYASVDLNNDGRLEYFVLFSTLYFCGSGGCSLLLIDCNFQLMTAFSVASPPIYIDRGITHGWKDLIIGSDGGYHIIKYNGIQKAYPNNPSIEESVNWKRFNKQNSEVLFQSTKGSDIVF